MRLFLRRCWCAFWHFGQWEWPVHRCRYQNQRGVVYGGCHRCRLCGLHSGCFWHRKEHKG